MSTFNCFIVQIGKVEKHPNADTLSITHIDSYPIVIRTGELNEGDKAIYIPEEALVPDVPMFEFLWTQKLPDGTFRVEQNPPERHRTVWARRLRGIFSMGLLIPVPESLKELSIGTDVAQQFGIEKYEKPEPVQTGGDNLPQEPWFVKYTEIEQIRKHPHVLEVGEEVYITEKIHGCNSRVVYHDNKLWVGSHNNIKQDDDINIWSKVIRQLGEERLKQHPDIIIFGEIYGQVQKGFTYDVAKGKNSFRVFDAFSITEQRYLNVEEFLQLAQSLELPTVPFLYRGPWLGLEQHEVMADGLNTLGGKHMREGFVVKPVIERWDRKLGRVILKLVGQEYLLTKSRR